MIKYNYFDFISTTINHLTIYKNNSKYLGTELVKHVISLLVFFFDNPGYLSQFTRTMTNSRAHEIPCKPNEQIRHREGNKHTQKKSNPSAKKRNKTLFLLGKYFLFLGQVRFCTRCRFEHSLGKPLSYYIKK